MGIIGCGAWDPRSQGRATWRTAVTTALAFGLDPQLTGLDIIRAWKERLGKQTPLKPLEVPSGPTGSKGPFGEWTGSPAEGCAVYLRRPARMVEHGAGQ